jgi:hypothetical protein
LAKGSVSVTPESKLGACEIVGLIGAGDMGEVYRRNPMSLEFS